MPQAAALQKKRNRNERSETLKEIKRRFVRFPSKTRQGL
jgi:hypothetical protein